MIKEHQDPFSSPSSTSLIPAPPPHVLTSGVVTHCGRAQRRTDAPLTPRDSDLYTRQPVATCAKGKGSLRKEENREQRT
ncbi:hypothetical protein E2C01_049685 [Portunus trituberculatus]|uniref:Uncharacterized protein n=1 Tax=Portunus trituberculatus TaxID=210409 RepID=A0A5B7GA45_PORTR|nr:hypothetical protein [Portunus trituberculatus]